MTFHVGENRIEFNKGFKAESLSQFLKTYLFLGSKEDVTELYDKLNGNDSTAAKKVRKTKSKSND